MIEPYYDHAGITIYHGDCREIIPVIGGADLIVTDPPYGVGRRYGRHYNDKRDGYWEWFLPVVELLRGSAPLMAMHHRVQALRHITTWDWVMTWHKPVGAKARLGNSPILAHWEPIFLWGIYKLGVGGEGFPDWISCNPAPSPRPMNGISPRNADDFNAVGHPLPKPLSVERKLIERLSKPGNLVLDPFMGSGTALRAAKDLGRLAIGIEIEEEYCEAAVERLAQTVLF